MNIKGQGHSLTLVQGHSHSTFSNFFSLETARPIKAKFHVYSNDGMGNKNLFKRSRSHDQDGRLSIYDKKHKNLLLRNHDTLKVGSSNDAPGSLCVCMGKSENNVVVFFVFFFRNYCSL